jgi:putative Mn2+ efflux pump MntP
MSFLALLALAVGLAMDAFAVSVAEGIVLHRITRRHALRLALYFGGFQAGMPVVGWLAGRALSEYVQAYDHWVAFALLMLIGGKMIADAVWGFETEVPRGPARGFRLLGLSIATSIDALAVGVSLAMLRVNVWWAVLWIGLVTGALSAAGLHLGDRVGKRLERWAEVFGGVMLCGIGLEILLRHTLASG